MASRFTETNKWSDPWFISLSRDEKLMFYYLCDNCDTAGFYEFSMKKFRDALGFTDEEIKQALIGIEKCYVLSRKKDVMLLKNFIKHQKNLPLNHKNNAHQGIFKRIKEFKDRFAHDLIKVVSKGEKPKQDLPRLEGLQTSIYGKNSNIDFNNFWVLYDKKVGDKKLCEKKWNSLKPSTQKKILEILPKWKGQFSDKTFQPYPETFLNQERWEDEISTPKPKSEFPDYYDEKFESKLTDQQAMKYAQHLVKLGWERITAYDGHTVGWRQKKAS